MADQKTDLSLTVIQDGRYLVPESSQYLTESSLLASMPSPMTVEEQRAAVEQAPLSGDIKTHPKGWQYVSAGYVRRQLNTVFGAGNWAIIHTDGFPRPINSEPGKSVTFLDHGTLLVHWSNGVTQRLTGYGEATYYHKNPNGLANALKAAEAEVVKAAAMKIGPRFGMGLQDLLDDGLILEGSGDMTPKDVVYAAIGTRYISDDSDEVLNLSGLREMASLHGGGDLESLDDRGYRTLAAIVQELPSVADKAALLQRAARLGLEIDGRFVSIPELKEAIAEAQKKQVADMEDAL